MCGALCVLFPGEVLMLQWCVDNLTTQPMVSANTLPHFEFLQDIGLYLVGKHVYALSMAIDSLSKSWL